MRAGARVATLHAVAMRPAEETVSTAPPWGDAEAGRRPPTPSGPPPRTGRSPSLALVDEGSSDPRPTLTLTVLDAAGAHLGGRPLDLGLAGLELLTLLGRHPRGLNAEELAAELRGDRGSSATVRVLVHRVRKRLGPWIDAAPYRLTLPVDTDARHVEALLTRGAVRAAAHAYPGPLLAQSEAPGIVREREALDAWVRHAVITSDDPEALWAWVRTRSGQDDAPAWKRLLANVPYSDPRRSLAASRLLLLRAAYPSRP